MSPIPRHGQVPYLYERLGPDQFQRLCAALLVNEFPGGEVYAFPAGPDGGRDAVRRSGERSVVFQVKWSKDPIKNAVAWLESTIRAEAPRIKDLAAAGATDYLILTSVLGSGLSGKGTVDRFDAILEQWSEELGIRMSCWWRTDIDARVDLAPKALKWAYSDMLAGNDAIRFLLEGDAADGDPGALRTLMLKVVGSQESEDARVKFKQVELDVYSLDDLFVDVEAVHASRSKSEPPGANYRLNVGGAARYLLDRAPQYTLVRGEPGQGKSTLGQYICQANRHALLASPTSRAAVTPAPADLRYPLRVDLRDYASWLAGEDPFAIVPTSKRRRLAKSQGSVESFLSAFMESHSGGLKCSVEKLHAILGRFPVLLVLDGLDEVGRAEVRTLIVREIDEFVGRHHSSQHPPQVVVTTRPNASGLPEPSHADFQLLELVKLSRKLRTEYLRKWADVNNVRGSNRRALEKTFKERSAEPHIALLSQNPMQLTILLYLIHKRGDSVPNARTPLYTSYVETLLDREGEKSREVVEHRADLEEVTSFLGWHLQANAEGADATGRLAVKELKRLILDYLFDVDKQTSLVDDLFTTVTDRVWALTSKVEGTFEFDVQPIREYFAARFLYAFAGADNPDFDSADLLRELVRRPYWINVCRFYVGFAKANELAGLVMGLATEFADTKNVAQVRTTTWALLSDGSFAGRSRPQHAAAELLVDDLSLSLLLSEVVDENAPKPAANQAGGALIALLRKALDDDPLAPLSDVRARFLLALDRQGHRSWMTDKLKSAAGHPSFLSWLDLAKPGALASDLKSVDIASMTLDPPLIRSLISSGFRFAPASEGERDAFAAFLDGQCSSCVLSGSGGYVEDALRAIGPRAYIAMSESVLSYQSDPHPLPKSSDGKRSAAFGRLKSRNSSFEAIQRSAKFNRGEARSTFPWANSAASIASAFGPCWIASEIAIIGAATQASVLRSGSTSIAGASALGPNMHYGELLFQLRAHKADPSWWSTEFERNADDLSRRTWTLALLSVADESVLREHLLQLEHAVANMSDTSRFALLDSSSRIGRSRLPRRIAATVPGRSESLSVSTLLSHFSLGDDVALHVPLEVLESMSQLGDFSWPAAEVVSLRAAADPSPRHMKALRHFARINVRGPSLDKVRDFGPEVLRDSAEFPNSWVTSTAAATNYAADPVPLVDVASRQNWFSAPAT